MRKTSHPLAGTARRIAALLLVLTLLAGGLFTAPQGENAVFSAAAAESNWKDLKKGSSGAEVKKAQLGLAALGYYDGRADGNFSRAFEEAVIAFQTDFGLPTTGRLDEETWLMITEDVSQEELSAPSDAQKQDPAKGRDARQEDEEAETPFVLYGESYQDKEHVAAYLRAFGELPPNYITKEEARALGWVSSWGNLWEVAPGKSIGGDRFGNYEGQLPTKKGRKYFECDIDFDGTFRNGLRIIYSNDGLIYYTQDHYNTFEDITQEDSDR